MFCFGKVSEARAVKEQPYSEKGGGEQQLIKIHVFTHQDGHFQKAIINYLFGIFC